MDCLAKVVLSMGTSQKPDRIRSESGQSPVRNTSDVNQNALRTGIDPAKVYWPDELGVVGTRDITRGDEFVPGQLVSKTASLASFLRR